MKISPAVFMLLAIACSAQTFQGRVMNGSTGNPQPSSQVILLTPSGEQGRAMTNDSGEFRIVPTVTPGRHASAVLKVTQDGVDYFQPVIPGQLANFKVYQSANRVGLISSQLSILQFQSVGKRLQVTELHALNNLSTPPLTQVDPDNFVLSIPPGAQIDPAIVSSPEGGTSKVPLTPVTGSTVQYRIEFPIKPGLTKYAIRYELPYDAREFVFRRQTQYPMNRVGVMIPKSMRFQPLSPHLFHPVADSQGAQEQQFELYKLASNAAIAFSLSGTGELAHSFRPVQPGERRAPTLPPPQTSAVSHAVLPANPLPAPRRSPVAGHERAIAVGILLSAGALVWLFMLRASNKAPARRAYQASPATSSARRDRFSQTGGTPSERRDPRHGADR
jgi:hypothetical protein